MLSYPATLVWPLALLGLMAVVALGVVARARGLTTALRLVAAVPLTAIPLVLAPLAAVGLWALLVWARPGYGDLMSFDPYRPGFYRWALAAATAAVVVTWYLALRRRFGPALLIGALVWPAVFGIAMAVLAPGMSYYGALTALAAALGGIAGVLTYGRRPVWHVVALTAGATGCRAAEHWRPGTAIGPRRRPGLRRRVLLHYGCPDGASAGRRCAPG